MLHNAGPGEGARAIGRRKGRRAQGPGRRLDDGQHERARAPQQDLVFVGAVSPDGTQAEAAKAFLAYLKTPEAIAVFKSKGVTPG
jgi:hypothetical protein